MCCGRSGNSKNKTNNKSRVIKNKNKKTNYLKLQNDKNPINIDDIKKNTDYV